MQDFKWQLSSVPFQVGGLKRWGRDFAGWYLLIATFSMYIQRRVFGFPLQQISIIHAWLSSLKGK